MSKEDSELVRRRGRVGYASLALCHQREDLHGPRRSSWLDLRGFRCFWGTSSASCRVAFLLQERSRIGLRGGAGWTSFGSKLPDKHGMGTCGPAARLNAYLHLGTIMWPGLVQSGMPSCENIFGGDLRVSRSVHDSQHTLSPSEECRILESLHVCASAWITVVRFCCFRGLVLGSWGGGGGGG